jgi:hypothetical protein
VHSPRFPFTRSATAVAAALPSLGIGWPVALDPGMRIWREYEPHGWPALFLWGRGGALRWYHLGEGEYLETEEAIHELLREVDPDVELPEPLDPIRAEDAPGVLLEPQTADVTLPADRSRLELVRDWTDGEDFIEAADAGAAATVSWSGGGAYAVLSGGELEPGLYETEGEVVAESPGVRLHGFQFTPGPPAPS